MKAFYFHICFHIESKHDNGKYYSVTTLNRSHNTKLILSTIQPKNKEQKFNGYPDDSLLCLRMWTFSHS